MARARDLAAEIHFAAGTFGFGEVGAAVGRARTLLSQQLDGSVEDAWPGIQAALDEARSARERARERSLRRDAADTPTLMTVCSREDLADELVIMGERVAVGAVVPVWPLVHISRDGLPPL